MNIRNKTSNCVQSFRIDVKLTEDSHALDMRVHMRIKASLSFKAALRHIISKVIFTQAFIWFPCIIYQEPT